MEIEINIEKESHPVEYELDAYGQWSKTEYSDAKVTINIHEKKDDKTKNKKDRD